MKKFILHFCKLKTIKLSRNYCKYFSINNEKITDEIIEKNEDFSLLNQEEIDEKYLVKDYTKSKTKIILNDNSKTETYKINTNVDIELKDNPIILKSLLEGKIDIKNPNLQVKSLNINDSTILFDEVKKKKLFLIINKNI